METYTSIYRKQRQLRRRFIGYSSKHWKEYQTRTNPIRIVSKHSESELLRTMPFKVHYGGLLEPLLKGTELHFDSDSSRKFRCAFADDLSAHLQLEFESCDGGISVYSTFDPFQEPLGTLLQQHGKTIIGYFAKDPQGGFLTDQDGNRLLFGSTTETISSARGGVAVHPSVPVTHAEYERLLRTKHRIVADALVHFRWESLIKSQYCLKPLTSMTDEMLLAKA